MIYPIKCPLTHGRYRLNFVAAMKLLLHVAMYWLSASVAQAQTVPVALNLPETVTADVVPGMRSLDVRFSVAGADTLGFELIVPVQGATFTLLDPSGNHVLASNDTRLRFDPGSERSPPLPGGVFQLSALAAPADGNWTIRLQFPPAPTKTVVLATIFARSRYQVGIAMERDTFLAGEDVGVGMAVLDRGVPIRGLSPTLKIGQSMAGMPAHARDDGKDSDGLADDGVYSVEHTFPSAGNYDVVGTVEIQTENGPIQRSAHAQVRVVNPPLQATGTTLTTLRGPNNCVRGIQVKQDFKVFEKARYSTLFRLTTSDGKKLDGRTAAEFAFGSASASAVFNAESLRKLSGGDGSYTLALIDSLKIDKDEFSLSFRKRNAGVFQITAGSLCEPAIELIPNISVTPLLADGYIASLQIAFQIKVMTPGLYHMAFKLGGPNGEDIALPFASRTLVQGTNQVVVDVHSKKFLLVDGPYQAMSLLVTAMGTTARLNTVGSTAAYTRWQFLPTKGGDLDGNGAIDAADVELLTQFRGLRAVIPGDRRDINQDGVIDLRDARALQGLIRPGLR